MKNQSVVRKKDYIYKLYLKLVNQNLSLPVDFHDQVTDGLFYFVGDGLSVFLDMLESMSHINQASVSICTIVKVFGNNHLYITTSNYSI